ncbi:MAG: NUDIX hydrolase [Acidobacteria bacterium]|nr:NUDIX hydrolase [Acidobacteriota bacterium]
MKLVSSKEILKTPIFRVTVDHALDPDGFEIHRAIVQHDGSAVMMPVDEKGRVLLVRQYRLPARRFLWELPAGRLDPGETPLKAARRELLEETGYRAKRWWKLVSFYPSPGFVAEKMTIFVAEDLTAGQAQPMDDERIECGWFTLKQMEELIGKAEIQDAKTIIGYSLWKLRKRAKPAKPGRGG